MGNFKDKKVKWQIQENMMSSTMTFAQNCPILLTEATGYRDKVYLQIKILEVSNFFFPFRL